MNKNESRYFKSAEKLKKLDEKAKLPAFVTAMSLGVVGALIFGFGMCLSMGILGTGLVSMIFGIILGLLGAAICGVNYPLYKMLLKKEKLCTPMTFLNLQRK